MNGLTPADARTLVLVLAIAGGALLILVVVLLLLWLRARRAFRRLDATRTESEWNRIDRELELAEQEGRFRIIRELQDVAVQAVTRLVAQAEGIRYAAASDPDAAARSAGALETGARDALADLRRVQTVVREGESAAVPQPSLHSARDLFRVMRDAGLALGFTESGDRFDLRPGAELAVFRILQGTLENALKHGGTGTAVSVGFAWTDEGLQVSVDDDGIRASARRAGLSPREVDQATQYTIDDDLRALTEAYDGAGLTEMRERAALFGGILNATTVPGVGFSVSVVFPALRFHNGVHGVNLGR
ncbi:sensor histidine kinase [Leifsonia poae]|uniref:sensor histidine kinase n=1 Tax=Leifsonia poae TaxID=110933 RepID=UPI001CBF597F|nr:histidine kinase [Leifsonia poae]